MRERVEMTPKDAGVGVRRMRRVGEEADPVGDGSHSGRSEGQV